MRVAITGAGGQVGSYLVKQLRTLRPSVQVIAVCRSPLAAKRLTGYGCEVRVGSLLDSHGARALLADCDIVVHCALSWENLTRRDSVNLAMIRAMERAAVKRLAFVSTVAVYSSCIQFGTNTYSKPQPDNDYGRDKVMCEREVASLFSSASGRQGFVLRLGHVYGAHVHWSRRILGLACNPRFHLPFDGRLVSNAVRTDRISYALVSLLEGELGPGVYNLTDDPNLTWRQVFDWHTLACGLPPSPPMDEAESQALREHFIALKRTTPARARQEIGGALASAVGLLTSSSPMLKSAARAMLRWTPTRLERSLRRRREAGLVTSELAPVTEQSLWEPSLALFFSDAAPGTYLRYGAQMPVTPSSDQEAESALAKWYRRWMFPDALWREQPPQLPLTWPAR